MSDTRRRATWAGLLVGLTTVASAVGPPCFGDSFEENFVDQLDYTGSARPADLSRLARLMVLESTSMSVYAAREVGDSPGGAELQSQVRQLWQAAAVFDQVVSGAAPNASVPGTTQRALADLQAAYSQVQGNLGTLPGSAPLAAYRLERISRLLPEVVGRVPPSASRAAVSSTSAGRYGVLRGDVRALGRQVVGLLALMKQAGEVPAPRVDGRHIEELRTLLALALGLDQFLAGDPPADAIPTVFQPIRVQSRLVAASIRERPPAAPARTLWRAIQAQVDRLSDQLELTRVLTPRPEPRGIASATPAIVSRIDQAVRQIESLLGEVRNPVTGVADASRIQEEAVRFRSLLYRTRQEIVAGGPRGQAERSLATLRATGRQLVHHAGGPWERRQARLRDLDRTFDELGRGLEGEAAVTPPVVPARE